MNGFVMNCEIFMQNDFFTLWEFQKRNCVTNFLPPHQLLTFLCLRSPSTGSQDALLPFAASVVILPVF